MQRKTIEIPRKKGKVNNEWINPMINLQNRQIKAVLKSNGSKDDNGGIGVLMSEQTESIDVFNNK